LPHSARLNSAPNACPNCASTLYIASRN